MGCRMEIHISAVVVDRDAATQLESHLSRILFDTTKAADIDVHYRYTQRGGATQGECHIPDTCGEVPEKVTGVAHDHDSEKPIILGEDAGDIAHSRDDWFTCRRQHLSEAYVARLAGDCTQCKGCKLSYLDCSSDNCPDYQPCADAGSGPHCAACPYSSVSPAGPGSAGPSVVS